MKGRGRGKEEGKKGRVSPCRLRWLLEWHCWEVPRALGHNFLSVSLSFSFSCSISSHLISFSISIFIPTSSISLFLFDLISLSPPASPCLSLDSS